LPNFSEAEVEKYKQSMQTLLFNTFRFRPKIMPMRVSTLYVLSPAQFSAEINTSTLHAHFRMRPADVVPVFGQVKTRIGPAVDIHLKQMLAQLRRRTRGSLQVNAQRVQQTGFRQVTLTGI
jgi:hypothetical protein